MKLICIFFFVAVIFNNINAQSYEGEWHILLIGATNDYNLSIKNNNKIIPRSIDLAKRNFTVMAKILNLKVVFTEVVGSDFIADNVRSAIKKLSEQPKLNSGKLMATIYSVSHGTNFKETWTTLPFMLCNPTNNHYIDSSQLIAVRDIYQMIINSSSFDHVHVWTELCNNTPKGLDKIKAPSQTMMGVITKGDNYDNLSKLLYSVKSSLIVSSQYKEPSWASNVNLGAFSNALFKTLEATIIGTTEPQFKGVNGFFERLDLLTNYNALKMGAPRQHPQCFVNQIL